jgi:hypothetical protein
MIAAFAMRSWQGDPETYGGTFMPMGDISRRTLIGSATAAVCLAALSKAGARQTEWKPRLGILGRYTEANVDFAIQEEFNNMILSAGAGVPGLDTTKITDEEIAREGDRAGRQVRCPIHRNAVRQRCFQAI